jgi:hypothetical protein
MRDVEMPVRSIRDVDIAIWPMSIGDLVDLHMCWKHVHNYAIPERHDARAELFAPDKLTVRRIHCEKVTFHPNEITFVTFHCSDKMTLSVILEELPMNNVNVFACVNDHKLLNLYSARRRESKFLLIVIGNAELSPPLATAATDRRI